MKNNFLVSLILFVAFLLQNVVFADTITKITIDEAINIALENSMDLKSEKISTEMAFNDIKKVNRLINPSLNFGYIFGDANKSNPNTLGVSQTIELLKRKNRKRIAKTNLQIANTNADFMAFTIKMNVKEAYIDLVAAKSILNSLELEKKSLEEIDRLAKARYKAGTGSETDVIQAEIALNQIITQINNAQAEVMSARFALNSAMDTDPVYDTLIENFDDDTLIKDLITPLPESAIPEYTTVLSLADENRFDLKIARNKIEAAEDNYRLASGQRVPDLEVNAGYNYQTRGMSDNGNYLSGAYAGVNLVDVPILYNYSPEIKNARLGIEKAKLQYSSLQNNAYANLSTAYERFVHAKMNLNYYNDSLIENSKQMMKTSKRNYEQGKTDLTSVIVIEQSYRSIIIGYAYALSKYCNSWIDLLREVNLEDLNSSENI